MVNVSSTEPEITQVQAPRSEFFVPTGPAAPAPPAEPASPGEAGEPRQVVVERSLEPTFIPQDDFEPLPTFRIPKRSLVVDIETTGVLPFQSRIIAISYLDPSDPAGEIKVIVDPDERQLVQSFVDVFEAQGYEELIGYNAPFDYRFLFAAATRYRIQAPVLFAADVYDLQDVYDKVRPGQVFGRNRSGSLEDWSIYLLGFGKPSTAEEVLSAWEEGNIDLVVDHVTNDVLVTYFLWLLDQHVKGNLTPAQSTELEALQSLRQESPTELRRSTGEVAPVRVQCTSCLAEAEAPETGETFKCSVCGNDTMRPLA